MYVSDIRKNDQQGLGAQKGVCGGQSSRGSVIVVAREAGARLSLGRLSV